MVPSTMISPTTVPPHDGTIVWWYHSMMAPWWSCVNSLWFCSSLFLIKKNPCFLIGCLANHRVDKKLNIQPQSCRSFQQLYFIQRKFCLKPNQFFYSARAITNSLTSAHQLHLFYFNCIFLTVLQSQKILKSAQFDSKSLTYIHTCPVMGRPHLPT